MQPDPQTDKAVRLFWSSFPTRKDAAKVLAAITLITNRTSPETMMSILRNATRVVEREGKTALLDFNTKEFAAMVVTKTPTDAELSDAEMLEHLMDNLVTILRDRKAAAT